MISNSSIPEGQKWLTQRMRNLGYRVDDSGVCHGNSCMAMQAVFAGDVDRFNKRLKAISDIPLENFSQRMEAVKQKRIKIVEETKKKVLSRT